MEQLNIVVPDDVHLLLGELERVLTGYDVFLAGGFLRDTFGGAPIKDIDILVSPRDYGNPHANHTNVVEGAVYDDVTIGEHWFRQTDGVIPASYMEGMAARGVHGLIMGECPIRNGQETQLIVYGRPLTVEVAALDMDLNICQIAMGTNGKVIASDSFVRGFKEKRIIILNGQGDIREVERVERMQRKYPDFTAG